MQPALFLKSLSTRFCGITCYSYFSNIFNVYFNVTSIINDSFWATIIYILRPTSGGVDTTIVTIIPRIEKGLNSQGGVIILFNKYCFPNLHRIHGNAIARRL